MCVQAFLPYITLGRGSDDRQPVRRIVCKPNCSFSTFSLHMIQNSFEKCAKTQSNTSSLHIAAELCMWIYNRGMLLFISRTHILPLLSAAVCERGGGEAGKSVTFGAFHQPRTFEHFHWVIHAVHDTSFSTCPGTLLLLTVRQGNITHQHLFRFSFIFFAVYSSVIIIIHVIQPKQTHLYNDQIKCLITSFKEDIEVTLKFFLLTIIKLDYWLWIKLIPPLKYTNIIYRLIIKVGDVVGNNTLDPGNPNWQERHQRLSRHQAAS